jgi:glycosyltransferase involved in cell wall biosynthesis
MIEISVVIPAYNAAGTLREAVVSALSQGEEVREVIIVVNGCTDDTMNVAMSLKEEDDRVLIFESRKGKVPARNKGFAMARFPFIALLDADDIWHAGKIKKQVAAFDDDIDIVGTQIVTTDKKGTILPEQITHPSDHDQIVSYLLNGRNCIANSSVVFRKSILDFIGTYEDCFPFCEDYHLWIRAIKFARMKNLPDRLVTYRFEHSPAYDPQIAMALSTFYKSLYAYTGVIR